ncbi:MAG: FAD-dependent oxidoreductase [Nitrospirae bacterium]|nr:FAD-dependent oxidoreductase [Nitrospirota bacterium]
MKKYDYDIIVIGGGAAGFVSSKLASGLGKKVAMIEKDKLGGECTLNGCVPSKALINSSRIAHKIMNAGQYGLAINSLLEINTEQVMSHVRSVVQRVYDGHRPEVFQKQGIDVLFGAPTFIDNHQILLNGKKMSANKMIISTGSSPLVPLIDGIDTVPVFTNQNIFNMERLPSSMIILGGGPIGAELGSAFNLLGVDVSVIHKYERILNKEDVELVDILSAKMTEEGVKLITGYKPVKVTLKDGRISMSIQNSNDQVQNVNAEALLVSVGRKANVEGLQLERAGVEYSLKGIKTTNTLQTTAPNIYACGDVAGPYRFSHMAEYQAKIAIINAILPFKKKVDYKNAAWATFTNPEIAHAGLTEEEARKSYGDRISIYKHEYSHIDRGKTDVSETGLGKFICDSKGRLIGAHILGARAGELIHETQIARSLGIPFYKLYSVIHIYPTFTDVVKQAAKLCYIDKLQRNPFLKFLRKFL